MCAQANGFFFYFEWIERELSVHHNSQAIKVLSFGRRCHQVIIFQNSFFFVCFIQKQGQNGFEELRRYVKQGSDFGKDLVAVLQER